MQYPAFEGYSNSWALKGVMARRQGSVRVVLGVLRLLGPKQGHKGRRVTRKI